MPSDSPSFNGGLPYEGLPTYTGGGAFELDLLSLVTGASGSLIDSDLDEFEFDVAEGIGLITSSNYMMCHVSACEIDASGVLTGIADETVGQRRIYFTLTYTGGVTVSGCVEVDVAAVGGGGGGGGGGEGGGEGDALFNNGVSPYVLNLTDGASYEIDVSALVTSGYSAISYEVVSYAGVGQPTINGMNGLMAGGPGYSSTYSISVRYYADNRYVDGVISGNVV